MMAGEAAQIQYRAATPADLTSVLEFEQGVVEAERPYNDKLKQGEVHYYDLAKLIESEQSLVLVAVEGDHLVATGHISIKESLEYLEHDRHGYLGLMYVDPAHRGRGIIQAIIDRLLKWGRAQGVEDFYLDVYADNLPAVTAYEKFGFRRNLIEMYLSY